MGRSWRYSLVSECLPCIGQGSGFSSQHDIKEKNKGRSLEYTFSPGRRTTGQYAHEKMLNITAHQRNANPKDSDAPFHSYCQRRREE
jgi:hypothetical protein